MISGNDNYLLVFPWEFSLYMGLLSHSLRPRGPFPSVMIELITERNARILGNVGMCGYTYVHPHVETEGSLRCCSSVIIHIFVEQGTHQVGCLANKPQGLSCVQLLSAEDWRTYHSMHCLRRILGTELRSLFLQDLLPTWDWLSNL